MKRARDKDMMEDKLEQSSSPFSVMFEGFRKELDEHHDRREKIIKASRDITAASKKIIFTLQRVRTLGRPLPPFVTKSNAQYWEIIEKQYKGVAADLQGLNCHRYSYNITGGNQEFMEALTFQHYLETQTLLSYQEAKSRLATLSGETEAVFLSPEDYILGICDMTGELMRFSITSMATNAKLPSGEQSSTNKRIKTTEDQNESSDKMDVDSGPPPAAVAPKPPTVLDDLRMIRLQLEMFEAPRGSKFAHELEGKKMPVMRECVDKVEKALYGLTVRGSERPKGWMPEVSGDKRAEVESF